jgi:hypothetical protein
VNAVVDRGTVNCVDIVVDWRNGGNIDHSSYCVSCVVCGGGHYTMAGVVNCSVVSMMSAMMFSMVRMMGPMMCSVMSSMVSCSIRSATGC